MESAELRRRGLSYRDIIFFIILSFIEFNIEYVDIIHFRRINFTNSLMSAAYHARGAKTGCVFIAYASCIIRSSVGEWRLGEKG